MTHFDSETLIALLTEIKLQQEKTNQLLGKLLDILNRQPKEAEQNSDKKVLLG